MGLNAEHSRGNDREIFIGYETTPLAYMPPATAHVSRVKESTLSFSQERVVREDARGTQTNQERIARNTTTSFTIKAYFATRGTFTAETNAPALHQLMYSIFGAYAVDASSHSYTLLSTQNVRSVSITHRTGNVIAEAVYGAVPNEMKMTCAQGAEPEISFTGPAIGHIHTGYATLNGALSGGEQNNIDIDAALLANLAVGSIIQVGTSNNTVGHRVTAVDRTNNRINLDSTVSGAQSDGALVVPFTPAASISDTVVAGISGSFQIDSVEVAVTALELAITRNIKETRKVFAAAPQDFVPNYRNVSGTMTLELTRDLAIFLGGRKLFQVYQIDVDVGSSGNMGTWSFPTVEFDFSDVSIPMADLATVQVPFIALGTDDDEVAFTVQ